MPVPQLGIYTQTVLEDLWKRPELSPRDRSIITVSSLVAGNHVKLLPVQISRALDNGVKPGEITEIITHLAFYAGWPNAMSAADAAKQVFAERKIPSGQFAFITRERLPLDKEADAKRAASVREGVGAVAPALANYTDEVLFHDLWLRPDLTPKDRSLVTVASLVTRGQSEQMAFHLNRAMDSGLTRIEAGEVVTHLAFYAGWPNAMTAAAAAKKVFEGRKPDRLDSTS